MSYVEFDAEIQRLKGLVLSGHAIQPDLARINFLKNKLKELDQAIADYNRNSQRGSYQ